MTASARQPLLVCRFLVVGLLATTSLPVCAVGPKTSSERTGSGGATSATTPVQNQKTSRRHAAEASADQDVARKTVVRQPAESPEEVGARLLPAGAETITRPLEFELSPLGRVVLVLYQLSSDDPNLVSDPSIYRGAVLVPDGKPGNYRIEHLPNQKDGAATLIYDVRSVFTADADGDGAPELCVLSEISEAGSGKAHTDTDLFKWTGSRFALVRQSEKRPLYNLRDAKAVRAHLKKVGRL